MNVSKTLIFSALIGLSPLVQGADLAFLKIRPARPDKPGKLTKTERPNFPDVAAAVARAREQQKAIREQLKTDKESIREQVRDKKEIAAVVRAEAKENLEALRILAREQTRKLAEEAKILLAESRRSR